MLFINIQIRSFYINFKIENGIQYKMYYEYFLWIVKKYFKI